MLLAGLGFLWLIFTRSYQYYVTPRTLPYLYFSAAVFIVLGVYNFTKLHEAAHIRRYAHLLALVLPLVMLAVSTKTMDLWSAPLFPAREATIFNDSASLDDSYSMKAPMYAGRVIHGYDEANKTITIMENETYFWMVEIYTDPTPFLGYTVRTMGQVILYSSYLSPDCFTPSRELMSCCVADMYSIGFPCQYDRLDTLTEGDWVSVSGTLVMADLEGYQELRILVDTVEESMKPDEPYVYPY